MNKYELTLVIDGKSTGAKKNKVIETLKKLLEVSKGKITESKDWGVKEMAYEIGKSTSGSYLFFEVELDPASIKSINDKLRIDPEILRFLLVKKEK